MCLCVLPTHEGGAVEVKQISLFPPSNPGLLSSLTNFGEMCTNAHTTHTLIHVAGTCGIWSLECASFYTFEGE